MKTTSGISIRAVIGVIVGAGIAAVDNFAFGGEISPIVIVGMLLVFSAAAEMIWGVRAALATAMVWVWLPMAHVLKHMMHLPDTIHPNTYASILKLAAFSFAVTAIGLGFGLGFRRLLSGHPTGNV
ncbi:MAG: hypothetical protein WBP91_17285 [Terriglobales bacterium]